MKQLGFYYNHVGASDKALGPLYQAYETEPHYKDLERELAYAHNVLGEYEKAVSILKKAINNNPNDSSFFKELGFAYINTDQLESAENIYTKGIEISGIEQEKAEMAVNMAQAFYKVRNREKFDKWADITISLAGDKSVFARYIYYFSDNWE